MSFQSTNIDNATLASDEVIAIVVSLDDIAGINKAVAVGERSIAADLAKCRPA
ncbi:MAG: hypothetical protein WBF07_19010 [Xanthobacteraceae bacterium]